MQTLTLQTISHRGNKGNSTIPLTARGRALYTVDWFINGKPILANHDNPRMTLRNGTPCC